MTDLRDYPDHPDFRRSGRSEEAADAMVDAAKLQRAKCYAAIFEAKEAGCLGNQAAKRIGMDNWKVRPRISESRPDGTILDSDRGVLNASGRKATVWVAAVCSEAGAT